MYKFTYIHYTNATLIINLLFHISNPTFFIFILKLDFLSNVIYKPPQKQGSKNGVFRPVLVPVFVLKPLYVVANLYFFPSKPQCIIRIILSTCLSLSHKSSCTSCPSLYTGKLKEIAFSGTSTSPRGYI